MLGFHFIDAWEYAYGYVDVEWSYPSKELSHDEGLRSQHLVRSRDNTNHVSYWLWWIASWFLELAKERLSSVSLFFPLLPFNACSYFALVHWKPYLGTHGLVWDEALKLGGQDRKTSFLWEHIHLNNNTDQLTSSVAISRTQSPPAPSPNGNSASNLFLKQTNINSILIYLIAPSWSRRSWCRSSGLEQWSWIPTLRITLRRRSRLRFALLISSRELIIPTIRKPGFSFVSI